MAPSSSASGQRPGPVPAASWHAADFDPHGVPTTPLAIVELRDGTPPTVAGVEIPVRTGALPENVVMAAVARQARRLPNRLIRARVTTSRGTKEYVVAADGTRWDVTPRRQVARNLDWRLPAAAAAVVVIGGVAAAAMFARGDDSSSSKIPPPPPAAATSTVTTPSVTSPSEVSSTTSSTSESTESAEPGSAAPGSAVPPASPGEISSAASTPAPPSSTPKSSRTSAPPTTFRPTRSGVTKPSMPTIIRTTTPGIPRGTIVQPSMHTRIPN